MNSTTQYYSCEQYLLFLIADLISDHIACEEEKEEEEYKKKMV